MEKDDIVNEMSLGNRLCDFFTYSSSFSAPSSIQMTSKISENFLLSHASSKFFDCTRFFSENKSTNVKNLGQILIQSLIITKSKYLKPVIHKINF